ncbi:recombinase family protein [Kiritimatiellaeota bacterium B1221]|nr:recombinase family protein [Kiritimatiellaeota bacterium B1221]
MKKPISAVYARTSKEYKGVEKVSIEQQIQDGITKAEQEGYRVPPEFIFVDRDKTQSKPPEQLLTPEQLKRIKTPEQLAIRTRPALTALLEACKEGKIQAVIARKVNRISRKNRMGQDIFALMLNPNGDGKAGIDIYGTHEHIPSQDGSTGKFLLGLSLLLSEYELDSGTENIKASKVYSKDAGLPMGQIDRLYGYDYDPDNKKKAIENKEQAKIVREVYRLYLEEGLGFRAIATKIDSKWSLTKAKRILSNPHYMGMTYNTKEELIASKVYPAIVTPSIWRKAQVRMASRKNTKVKSTAPAHLTTGFLKCYKCKKSLTPHIRHNKEEGRINYMSCDCPVNGIPQLREDNLEEWVKTYIASTHIEVTKEDVSSQEIVTLQLKLDKLISNKETLEAKASEADFDMSLLLSMMPNIKNNISKIEKEIEEKRANAFVKNTTKIEWSKLSLDEKRDYIYTVVSKMICSKYGIYLSFRDGVKIPYMRKEYYSKRSELFFPFISVATGEISSRGKPLRRIVVGYDKNTLEGTREYTLDAKTYKLLENKSVRGPDYSLQEDIRVLVDHKVREDDTRDCYTCKESYRESDKNESLQRTHKGYCLTCARERKNRIAREARARRKAGTVLK